MARLSKEGPPPIRPSNEGFLATPAAAAKAEQWRDELNIIFAYFCFLKIGRRLILKRKKFESIPEDDITCVIGAIVEFPPRVNLSPGQEPACFSQPCLTSSGHQPWAAWVSHFVRDQL